MKALFRVRMRLGHFDPPGPLQDFQEDDICSDYAHELSLSGLVQVHAAVAVAQAIRLCVVLMRFSRSAVASA